MNFQYLTFLFSVGCVLDLALSIIAINSDKYYLFGLVMLGVFFVHMSLIELFYRSWKGIQQTFRTRTMLTLGNIFVISVVSYILFLGKL